MIKDLKIINGIDIWIDDLGVNGVDCHVISFKNDDDLYIGTLYIDGENNEDRLFDVKIIRHGMFYDIESHDKVLLSIEIDKYFDLK